MQSICTGIIMSFNRWL